MAKDHARAVWDPLVQHVAVDDGLPVIKTAGYWTRDKLFFLCRYLEQTTRGMKYQRSKFARGLAYIDLFCGPGVSVVSPEAGPVTRLPGSPLIAAAMPYGFDRMILVDCENESVEAARARVLRLGYRGDLRTHCGDVNRDIEPVIELVPRREFLNVTFVDPFSLDVHFATIRQLAEHRALDLIILFCDRFDLGRNYRSYYYPNPEQSKLDAFLGIRDWRERLDRLGDESGQNVRALFATIYQEQLRSIGYHHAEHWPLIGPNGPAFRLFFASKHELGLKFCRIARELDASGQRDLFSSG